MPPKGQGKSRFNRKRKKLGKKLKKTGFFRRASYNAHRDSVTYIGSKKQLLPRHMILKYHATLSGAYAPAGTTGSGTSSLVNINSPYHAFSNTFTPTIQWPNTVSGQGPTTQNPVGLGQILSSGTTASGWDMYNAAKVLRADISMQLNPQAQGDTQILTIVPVMYESGSDNLGNYLYGVAEYADARAHPLAKSKEFTISSGGYISPLRNSITMHKLTGMTKEEYDSQAGFEYTSFTNSAPATQYAWQCISFSPFNGVTGTAGVYQNSSAIAYNIEASWVVDHFFEEGAMLKDV